MHLEWSSADAAGSLVRLRIVNLRARVLISIVTSMNRTIEAAFRVLSLAAITPVQGKKTLIATKTKDDTSTGSVRGGAKGQDFKRTRVQCCSNVGLKVADTDILIWRRRTSSFHAC